MTRRSPTWLAGGFEMGSWPRYSMVASGGRLAVGVSGLLAGLQVGSASAQTATWRLGDDGHPWRLHPVSQLFDAGETYQPDYEWGGSHAVEVVVDDDGDGAIDEDPVDLIDNDADGLVNEDWADGLDNDGDGLIDEDGADGQRDNDGDGRLNEDGRHSGGPFWDPILAQAYTQAPFHRPRAAGDTEGDSSRGYGFGDDDYDGRFNEDAVDGVDNDGDGLVDEDAEAAPIPLPEGDRRIVYEYDLNRAGVGALIFHFDAQQGVFEAVDTAGDTVVASPVSRLLTPTDWLRPVRLDSLRNLSRVLDDRFLSGIYGHRDPFNTARFGAERGTNRHGDTGYGQIVDGDITTARNWSQRTENTGFRVELLGAFRIDLLRLRPRPGFPDRSPSSFHIHYASDSPQHVQERLVDGLLHRRLLVNDFIIPQQVDQVRPPIKEFHFDGGEHGSPPTVRALDFRGDMDSGVPWEIAEFEIFGSGYSRQASLVSEIVDLGRSQPVSHRFFDPDDPSRPMPFESFTTRDVDGDGHIDSGELAQSALAKQVDFNAPGQSIILGDLRWRLQLEGQGSRAHLRIRSGTSPDTRIYQRGTNPDLRSPFVDDPIVLDWPAPGTRLDAYSYAALSAVQRAEFRSLPLNEVGAADGASGGWTPWSSPIELTASAQAPASTAFPFRLPLSRYVQLRVDFTADSQSGTAIDFIEVDYGLPVAGNGILAQIMPTQAQLGTPSSYTYVLLPQLDSPNQGFNRVDVAVPSMRTQLLWLRIDNLQWIRVETPPGVGEDVESWLTGLDLDGNEGSFAAAVYADSSTGGTTLSVKVPALGLAAFPPGQGRTIEIAFETAVFQRLTEFPSWLWKDDVESTVVKQRAEPGDASRTGQSSALKVFATGAVDPGVRLVRLTPNPFSPNGDEINDLARFHVQALSFLGTGQLRLQVHSLVGHMVHRAVGEMAGAGDAMIEWDGRDSTGRVCAPGVYLYRISLHTAQRQLAATATGTIALVY